MECSLPLVTIFICKSVQDIEKETIHYFVSRNFRFIPHFGSYREEGSLGPGAVHPSVWAGGTHGVSNTVG